MTDNSLSVSQLPTALNVASTDRVLLLYNAVGNTSINSGNASVRTVNVSILTSNVFIANLTNGSNTVSLDANGVLNLPLGIQMGANIEGEGATGFDIYAPSSLAYMGLSYGANASNGTASYVNIYKLGSDPITSPHVHQLQIWNGNTNPSNSYSNWLFDAANNRFSLANNSYIYFSDSTMQYTAFNTNTAYTFSNLTTFSANVKINTTLIVNNEIAAGNGFYSNSTFAGAPSYGDGIVVDYTSTNGRISVGSADSLTFYTGGVATTQMAVINSTGMAVNGSISTTSNTFNLGSASKAANGYVWLPNGILHQWGTVSANSSTGNATFAVAFPTACQSVTLTAIGSANVAYQAASPNTTVATIRTSSITTGVSVQYHAIGY
jgi:hypothetical protein